jgi:glycosyltransferase involved in cell wall biosynthesis
VVGFDLDGFHYGRHAVAPYVASIKGVIADELTNERGAVRAMLALQARLERLAVRRAQVVVATSRYSRRRIADAYGVPAGKIVVVPEAIDPAAWERPPREPREEPPAILSVAHLYPRKNLEALLCACRLLQDGGRSFRVWIVGEGPCRKAWEALRDQLGLADEVCFLGTVPFGELRARYAAASIFCLPSRQEGFGIVFLEAMASGLPIVAARAAAVPETVGEDGAALLVEPEDHVRLAEVLDLLLSDPARRHAMGEAGRRRVQHFRREAVTLAFLQRVAGALAGDDAGPAAG